MERLNKSFVVVAGICFLTALSAGKSVYAGTPENRTNSNITNTAFTVSWTTGSAEIGQVNYSNNPANLSNSAYDTRGAATSDDTHYVTISGLSASTTYYYDIISGGITYDNGGSHFTCATGPALAPSASDTIYGKVYKSDGVTAAEGTIVSIIVKDNDGAGTSGQSQVLSSLVAATAYWSVNIGGVRTENLSSYFVYSASGDNVEISAQGEGDGTASQTVDTNNDAPAPDMVLTLSTGTISGRVTDAEGNAIEGATASDGTRSDETDGNGDYTITDVPVGTYTVTCTATGYADASESNVVVQGGETTTSNFSLSASSSSSMVLENGVVFDSLTNNPIKGAVVTLYKSNGTICSPGREIASNNANPQTTGSDGGYSFNVTSRRYYLRVSAAGYNFPSERTTFPSGRRVATGSKGEVFTISGEALTLDMPLDSGSELLKITKQANKKEVKSGEVVTYEVKIENETAGSVINVYLEDKIPAGFKYISGKTILDGTAIAEPTGKRPLTFNIGTMTANSLRTLKYQLVVGSGVSFGKYENEAYAKYPGGTRISNIGHEEVSINPDALFDMGTVIGKVFWDINENGIQDDNVRCWTLDVRREKEKKGEKGGVSIREIRGMAERDGFDRKDLQSNERFSGQRTFRNNIADAASGSFDTTEHRRRQGALSQQSIHSVSVSGERFSVRTDNFSQDSMSTSVSSRERNGRFAKSMQRDSGKDQQINQFNKTLDVRPPMLDAKAKASSVQHLTSNQKETGISEVRIYTEEGRIITTDRDGKFHLSGLSPGRHLFRLDERSLPEGAFLTTDKVVLVDITPGILSKVNFGIKMLDKEMLDVRCPTVDAKTKQIAFNPEKSLRSYGAGIQRLTSNNTYSKQTGVDENYLFFVALADGKIGYTKTEGNIEPVQADDKFRGNFWSEGKLAYYLEGKIKGKYLITSSLDSKRGQKELLKDLDSDKYYPVYGDASKTNYEAANTQGMFYVLIKCDKSNLLWGNYETGFTETELADYSRTLYGGRVYYESHSTTQFGDAKTKLIMFGARAKQQAAHNEFLGTGGSLYYLSNGEVIEGSEKVIIEVRDKITGLVLEKIEQKKASDYEINYSEGRIIFRRPVSWTVQADSIISARLLDGHRIYVVVDYEYEVKDKYNQGVYGVRAAKTLTDYLKLGGTYIKEEKYGKNYQLKGADAVFYLGKDTKLTAEYAESESEGVNSFVSVDGGLNWTTLSTAESAKGRAYGLKGEIKLHDNLRAQGYYKKLKDGFSTSSTISQQGKELIGGGMTLDISPRTKVNVKHDIQELIENGNSHTALQVGAKKTETSTAQIVHEMEKLRFTGEYRRQRAEKITENVSSETNEEGDIVAARAEYQLSPNIGLSLEQQATLKGSSNNQTTAGIEAKLFDGLNIRGEQTVGNRGSAASLGLESEREGVTTYGYWAGQGRGKETSFVFGEKRPVGDDLELRMEKECHSIKDEKINTNILGLSGILNEQVGMGINYERGLVQHYSGEESIRNAGSLTLSYAEKDSETGAAKILASTKLELRLDEGQEDKRQYLSHNAVEWKANSDLTLFGKVNFSQTENKTGNFNEGEYKEFATGLAYRPVNFDRFNLLAKYTYLSDDSPSGQSDFADIDEKKAHIYGVEGLYDLTDKMQLVEKIAFRIGEEKVSGFDWTETNTYLWINRLNYKIADNWHLAGEYRLLTQREADDKRKGVLVELARDIGKFIQLGCGYNWTDFNDDLTDLDYTCHGPFVRLTGNFSDQVKQEQKIVDEVKAPPKILEDLTYKTEKECLDIIGKNPDNKKVFYNLIELYILKNRAIKCGRELYAQGNCQAAIAEWQKALSIAPNNRKLKRYIKKAQKAK